jgi:hypothetical protein
MTSTTAALVAEINEYRAARGIKPLTAFKKARHIPELEAYRADARANDTKVVPLANAPAKPGPQSGKPATKKALVASMMQTGTTLDAIASTLQINRVAARSLIQDVKRLGVVIVREGDIYRAS